jgi:hypothetical protein
MLLAAFIARLAPTYPMFKAQGGVCGISRIVGISNIGCPSMVKLVHHLCFIQRYGVGQFTSVMGVMK